MEKREREGGRRKGKKWKKEKEKVVEGRERI
jgi:hypothetical protein